MLATNAVASIKHDGAVFIFDLLVGGGGGALKDGVTTVENYVTMTNDDDMSVFVWRFVSQRLIILCQIFVSIWRVQMEVGGQLLR